MGWPTPDNYDEAVQNLHHSMGDEELRAGQAALDDQQLPMVWAGNFARVYKIHCSVTGNTWALKCFTKEVQGQAERYSRIAECLKRVRLPFTVPFEYLERGVTLGGRWFPALKMEWIEGQPLNRFVEASLGKPAMLGQLLDWWPRLAARVREAGIAHADLQHGNVLLVPMPKGQLAIKLIDYDGMYVPALAGTKSGELGHAAYQHPQRFRQRTYSADVDRFSHLVIYTAVRCLMVGRGDLWRRFDNGDNLLFRETDFQGPATSDVFRTLWELRDADARALVGRLILACGRPLEQTPLLDEITVKGKVLPLSRAQEAAVNGVLLSKPFTEPVATTPSPDSAATRKNPCLRALAAAARPIDALLRRFVGEENDILRYFLWAALPLLLLVAIWAAIWGLTPSTTSWKLRPIASQTVEAAEETARKKAGEVAARKKAEEVAARAKAESEAAQKKAEEDAARAKVDYTGAQNAIRRHGEVTSFLRGTDKGRFVSWKAAAEKRMPEAQWLFGCVLLQGVQSEKDPVKAASWFRKSAEQGCAPAQFDLGVCYHTGQGVSKDYAEAVKWYRMAAEQGCVFGDNYSFP
jgi:serine/threonine protein kinase